jgi:iron complex outermembrane receptor protein
MATRYKVNDRWRLAMAGSLFTASFRDGLPGQSVGRSDSSPGHQLTIGSNLDLPRRMEFDTQLYVVGRLPGTPLAPQTSVPGYTRLDVRLGWRPNKKYEFSLGVQNLLGQGHQEFILPNWPSGSADRFIYGKLVWRP